MGGDGRPDIYEVSEKPKKGKYRSKKLNETSKTDIILTPINEEESVGQMESQPHQMNPDMDAAA